jgi:hypothetical protein
MVKPRAQTIKFVSTKRKTYIAEAIREKGQVPGVGHYKSPELSLDKVHRPYTKSGRR